MKVSTLLEGLEYICCQGSTEQEVTTVVYDSRKVEENSLFICIRGAVVDGHKFVPDVIENSDQSCGHPLCDGIYFCGIFRSSGKRTQNYWNYRNKRKDNDNLHGKIDSGKCRL